MTDENTRLPSDSVVEAYDMSIHHNPDAQAWAKFYCETFPDADEDLMQGWFANAMMAMHDWLLSGDGQEKAKRTLAAQPRDDGWQPMDSAPLDGTDIQARIPGNGSDNVIAWQNEAFLNDDNEWCGGWAFTTEQEPPDCWTDGVCWSVNEDGVPSLQPSHWKHLPDTALSQGDEQPAIPDMTDEECATAYRDLRKRANDAGFATVGEWIDEQPDTQGTDSGLADEMTRSEVKALWVEHGGSQHGPMVEHYTIEEQAFYRFAAAFQERTRALAEGAGQ